jgi:hypothetical protein
MRSGIPILQPDALLCMKEAQQAKEEGTSM